VSVSDNRVVHVGSDFYADVSVVDPQGRVVARWKDPEGQDSPSGVKAVLSTMNWADEVTLEFTSKGGPVAIRQSGERWIVRGP
jgi:hypothetical protein